MYIVYITCKDKLPTYRQTPVKSWILESKCAGNLEKQKPLGEYGYLKRKSKVRKKTKTATPKERIDRDSDRQFSKILPSHFKIWM